MLLLGVRKNVRVKNCDGSQKLPCCWIRQQEGVCSDFVNEFMGFLILSVLPSAHSITLISKPS